MQNFFGLYIKPYLLYLDTHSSVRYLILTIILFILVLLLTDKSKKEKPPVRNNFNAIAGEDVMATQLDLAKAYIEMGQKDLALTILKNVKRKGTENQYHEAERLIKTL